VAPDPTPTETAAAIATASAATPNVVFLDPPPVTANIPAPPAGYVRPTGETFRSVLPRGGEETALPIAVKDLGKFTTYAQTLGATAPPYAQVLQTFDVANQWSSMRSRTAAWDTYCALQEGIAWTSVRAQMDRLRPSFQLAVTGDPTVATTYPGLATLLFAKKAIALRGASTRALNKKALAVGKEPLHGQAGKKRKKAAEKAAYLAANATEVAPLPTPVVAPVTAAPAVVAPAHEVVAAAPVVAAAAPVVVAAPVVATPVVTPPVANAGPVVAPGALNAPVNA
jgi:hypothetical protein